jgi:PhnB protein
VDDADAVGAAFVRGGARVVYPIRDQGYGSRGGRLEDPFGHLWMISQQLADLSPEEIQPDPRPVRRVVGFGWVGSGHAFW